MEKIKLVIWDLDETFWKGTLSEGGISIIPENISIVKELTNRGIINSISSKNDYDLAKLELEKAGVWDYFVFPSIAWTPKGHNVKTIIDNCQLRSPNVLFIDDNHGNRKEVEHYNPGINALNEDVIPRLLYMPELKGKDDSSLSRLKQYKLLEKKHEVSEAYSDNHAFLLDSQITLTFISDTARYFDRIFELINRTNQLNFTKKRLKECELSELLNSPDYQNGCIHVKDRFGDYGICGFYCINKNSNELTHFLFSCRILNMGIEAYVYQKLNKPKLGVVEPVSGKLATDTLIDWIEEIPEQVDDVDISKLLKQKDISTTNKLRILLLGGCDLEQVCHYINSDLFDIIKEFNYPNEKGIPVHKEHTVFLRDMKSCTDIEKKEIFNLPFGDVKMFDSLLYSNDYDILVYSALMNYTQDVYRRKGNEYKVAFGGYTKDKADALSRLDVSEVDKSFFSEQFEYLGQQTPEEFQEDIEWLISQLSKPIVFINGAEVDDFNGIEEGACARHQSLNKVLDDVIAKHPNQCKLLDMRVIVNNRNQNTDNIRHYIRSVYVQMAENLMTLLRGEKVKVRFGARINYHLKVLLTRIAQKIKRVFTL